MQFEEISIKEVKNYWNARPCNIRHSPKEIGTREYFDEIEARKYKALTSSDFKTKPETIIDFWRILYKEITGKPNIRSIPFRLCFNEVRMWRG